MKEKGGKSLKSPCLIACHRWGGMTHPNLFPRTGRLIQDRIFKVQRSSRGNCRLETNPTSQRSPMRDVVTDHYRGVPSLVLHPLQLTIPCACCHFRRCSDRTGARTTSQKMPRSWSRIANHLCVWHCFDVSSQQYYSFIVQHFIKINEKVNDLLLPEWC